MKTGLAPGQRSVSVLSENPHMMGLHPHQIWSYKPMKLSMFCGFGVHG